MHKKILLSEPEGELFEASKKSTSLFRLVQTCTTAEQQPQERTATLGGQRRSLAELWTPNFPNCWRARIHCTWLWLTPNELERAPTIPVIPITSAWEDGKRRHEKKKKTSERLAAEKQAKMYSDLRDFFPRGTTRMGKSANCSTVSRGSCTPQQQRQQQHRRKQGPDQVSTIQWLSRGFPTATNTTHKKYKLAAAPERDKGCGFRAHADPTGAKKREKTHEKTRNMHQKHKHICTHTGTHTNIQGLQHNSHIQVNGHVHTHK